MAYFEGEIPVVTTGNNNNNGWNDWSWIVALALIGGIFGNGGFGFGGGNRGGYGYTGIAENYALATDFATIERKLDSVNSGICDATFALNNTITNGNFNIINSLTQGFSGLNTALLQTNYTLSSQLAQCCCDTRSAIADVKYANERQTCDLITNANANTQRIIDFMVGEKLASKDARIASLEAQISNDRQSRYIVDALSPKCPQPAYVVQPPQEVTFPTNCCGNVAYANYSTGSCGCGL